MDIFSDEYFMRIALQEAKKALEQDEIPIGAIIVSNNRVIAKSHNLTEKLNDVTAHAEMQAITAAANTIGGKYLPNCTLYVTVEPCPMCAGALGWSQIGKIVFGTPDTKRGYQTIAPNTLHPKTQIIQGILQQQCADLMKQFFITKRNR